MHRRTLQLRWEALLEAGRARPALRRRQLHSLRAWMRRMSRCAALRIRTFSVLLMLRRTHFVPRRARTSFNSNRLDSYRRYCWHVAAQFSSHSRPLQGLDFAQGAGDVSIFAEAVARLRRCGVVALQNVLNRSFLHDYRAAFTDFAWKLQTGEIDTSGKTSNGERFFMHRLQDGGSRRTPARWEMLLPRSFASQELVRASAIDGILSHFAVLGPRYVLHSLGVAIAEAGVAGQVWHCDSPYPFEWGTAAGSDIPPYAITMMVPLLNLTVDHGPTIFCIGTSHTHGVFPEAYYVASEDPTFRAKAFLQISKDDCREGTGLREVQHVLQFGDAVLFDYQTFHRGGRNLSPDTRAVLYLTFSRPWYKDEGFDDVDGEFLDERELSADATAKLASAAGTPLGEISPSLRSAMLRITRPARFAEPYSSPNSSFTEAYQKQALDEGATRKMEVLAGNGYLFPSWVDIDVIAQGIGDDEAEDDADGGAPIGPDVEECPASAVFVEPYTEQDYW